MTKMSQSLPQTRYLFIYCDSAAIIAGKMDFMASVVESTPGQGGKLAAGVVVAGGEGGGGVRQMDVRYIAPDGVRWPSDHGGRWG